MRKIRKWLRNEDGASTLIEATIIYPIVFMSLFLLVYAGLYILQTMTLSSYAQKVAMLAAREVAYPGYLKLSDTNVYKSAAVEADYGEDFRILNTTISGAKVKIKCTFDTGSVKTDAYRYWKSDPLSDSAKETLCGILVGDGRTKGLATSQTLIGTGAVNARVTCDNNIVSQNVEVTLEQELVDFSVLHYFGLEVPKAKAVAKATVSDSDELVRNTDFIVDTLEVLADKLGIDVSKIRDTIDGALEKIGLK